jgi:two-component system sensor histidine kinase/response regulator
MPHILIVDDVLDNIQLLGRVLHERIECSIAVAQDGEAALRAVDYQRPDLILLDVMMPRMSGHDVCRHLKADPETADIPIIFLTAKVEEDDIVAGLEMGAADYVTKPVRQEVLLARVRTQLKILEKEQRIVAESRQRSNLLHILCHDMANPIAAVRGFVHLLNADCDESQQELLDLASTALESANGIIVQVRETLALAEGKRSLTLEPLTLSALVEESVAILDERFRDKSIQVVIELEDDGPVLAEKISFINSVLNNLLTNAVKFSDPGGTVTLRSRAVESGVELVVEDQGIGMSPELAASVFDFSSSTSRVGTMGEEGTGYGMPLLKGFMDAYGGDVTIESNPRSGSGAKDGFTRIRLTFQRATDEGVEEAEAE